MRFLKQLLKEMYLALRSIFLYPFLLLRNNAVVNEKQIKKILVLRHDRIGDMVITTALLRALKERYPGAGIKVLVSKTNREGLENDPDIAGLIIYKSVFDFWVGMRSEKPDLAVDPFLTYELKSAFLTCLSGARYRIGFEEAAREIFFNIRGPKPRPKKHTLDHLLDLAKCLGCRPSSFEPRLYLRAEEIQNAEELLAVKNINGGMRIAVHPGAHYLSQRWPKENFADLSARLIDEFGATVILFGHSSEAKLLEYIKNRISRPGVKIFCCASLRDFMALLTHCHLLICNNSGALHIASALGVPTVSTIGPTDAALWQPRGHKDMVINKKLSCSPCAKAVCKRHSCLRRISVEEIFLAVKRQILRWRGEYKIQAGNTAAPINKILIVNLGGIGDILLSFPALKVLRQKYPLARIYFLGTPTCAELIPNMPFVDDFFFLHLNLRPQKLYRNLRMLIRLRRENIDVAVNMRTLVSLASAFKMKMLLNLINPRIKAGRNTNGLGSFLDIKVDEEFPGDRYEAQYDIDTVVNLGADSMSQEINFHLRSHELRKIERILKRVGVGSPDVLVGIHAGGNPSHRWPQDNYSGLMRILARETGCSFVLTGGNNDRELEEKFLAVGGIRVFSFIGRLSLQETAGLIKRCDLFISNDTGPMHIAAILNKPLIAIFGPGYLERFDPRTISANAVVLHKRVSCAPCNRKSCRFMHCLKGITPEEVSVEAIRLLKKNIPRFTSTGRGISLSKGERLGGTCQEDLEKLPFLSK